MYIPELNQEERQNVDIWSHSIQKCRQKPSGIRTEHLKSALNWLQGFTQLAEPL